MKELIKFTTYKCKVCNEKIRFSSLGEYTFIDHFYVFHRSTMMDFAQFVDESEIQLGELTNANNDD